MKNNYLFIDLKRNMDYYKLSVLYFPFLIHKMSRKKYISRFSIRNKPGEIPGALHFIGEEKAGSPFIRNITYNTTELTESPKIFGNYASLLEKLTFEKVNWLDVEGLNDIKLMENIGKKFLLHNLLLEDVLNTTHRPKIEEFENATLVIVKMLSYNKIECSIVSEHISLVLAHNTLISFQEIEGDVFEPIRERIRHSSGKIRIKDANYLLFTLLDAIVDNYFSIIEYIGEELEKLEDSILNNPSDEVIKKIHYYNRQIIVLRKAVWPLREVINGILKGVGKVINESNELYFRDLYDNTIQVIETIEMYKDTISGLRDLAFSNISNKMNDIMKTLTVMSSIFTPLTFIAGLYGMNFDNMPELHSRYGYFAVLGVMMSILIILLYIFRRSKWL